MRILFLIFIILISGCTSIRQTVTPFEHIGLKEICIIDNPKVARKNFLQVYTKALQVKGYTVKMLDKDASTLDCEITSTYTATWGWDLALYMSYAKINIYNNGGESAEAVYKLVRPGLFGKFISAEKKINELVDQLFVAHQNQPDGIQQVAKE